MIVGICKIGIVFDEGGSLKGKRKVLRKIKDTVLSRYKVSISEVGENDKWRRTELGFAVVGNSKQKINSVLDKVSNFIYDMVPESIVNRDIELIHFKGDQL